MATRRPDAPLLLEPIVARLLARKVADRYADAGALLRDLQQVRDDLPAAQSPGETSDPGANGLPERWSGGRLLAGGERMQVTVVVWALGRAGDPGETCGTEDPHRLALLARPHTTEVVRQHGGIVQRIAGGQIVALFGIPTPREDDCVQAARAALALAARLRGCAADNGEGVAVGMGLDTGMVLARRPGSSGHPERVRGSPLRVAARLARYARANEILASPASRRLLARSFHTEDGPRLRLRGKGGDETPARVVAESTPGDPLDAAGADQTAFTGRDKEMEALVRCLRGAAAGEGQLVTLSGEAGLGKTRLLQEFRGRMDGITVLRGHCSPRGTLQPFQPFIEALQDHFGIGPDIGGEIGAERVVGRIREVTPELDPYAPLYLHLLSLPGEAHPPSEHLGGESLKRVLPKALAAVFTLSARRNPLVLLLEDWHWSDEGSRKVLDQLVELIPAYPLLVVVTCRPEYTPAWAHAAHQTMLRLTPLEESASKQLVRSTLGADHVPDFVGALLHERTGGNPFFLEEICRALGEEGAIRIETGRLIPLRPLDRLPLPNTVQAVIRTRLHRLDGQSRVVLRAASVVGHEFTRDLLRLTLRDEVETDALLDAPLEALRRAGLIHQTNVLPAATYRFRHVLTREVAYESLPQHHRRRLHRLVGQALEERFADRIEEHAEMLAHHFGEAKDWRKVVRYSGISAERGRRLGQYSDTLAHFAQTRVALDRLPDDAERRHALMELLLRRERVLETIASHEEQQADIDELFSLIEREDDPETLAEVHIRQGDLHILQGRFQQAEEALNEALHVGGHQAHGRARQKALRSMGFLRWHQDRHEEAVSINEQLVALDRQRGDTGALGTDLLNLLTVLKRLKEFDRGLICAEELLVLSEQFEDPLRQLPMFNNLGEFYRDLGDHTRALVYIGRSIDIAETYHFYGSHSYQLSIRAQILLEDGRVEESIECYKYAIGMYGDGRSLIGRVGPVQGHGRMGLAGLLRRLGEILVAMQRVEEV